MKINEHTALSTAQILLVPYSDHHVPTYHEWMKDPDLQEATASEPLSLDEEYSMQKSWRTDSDKLTFIICLPLDSSSTNTDARTAIAKTNDAPHRMVGDINLFLFPPDSDEMSEDVSNVGGNVVGEIELMIARKDMRQKGLGRSALLTFLEYILANWSRIASEYADFQQARHQGETPDTITTSTPRLSFLRVKVHKTNVGSIKLFESVGFVRTVEDTNYFGEIELRWLPDVMILRRQKGWEEASELEYKE